MMVSLLILSGCGSSGLAPVVAVNTAATGSKSTVVQAKPQRSFASSVYRVKPGDTLYSIARRFATTPKELSKINGLSSPSALQIGQKLALVRTKTHSKSRKQLPKVRKKAYRKKQAVRIKSAKALSNRKVNARAHWLWPTRGDLLTSFGAKGNKGIDIKGKFGQPVIASANGKVAYAGNGLRGYGNLVIIKHADRYLSAYAHNRKLLVKEGQSVKAGQKIAEMGSRNSQTAQLHFEIRLQGKPVNPLGYLPHQQG